MRLLASSTSKHLASKLRFCRLAWCSSASSSLPRSSSVALRLPKCQALRRRVPSFARQNMAPGPGSGVKFRDYAFNFKDSRPFFPNRLFTTKWCTVFVCSETCALMCALSSCVVRGLLPRIASDQFFNLARHARKHVPVVSVTPQTKYNTCLGLNALAETVCSK